MPSIPPEELMPVLVADLADDEALDILEAAVFTGSRVYVPLENAPVNASAHVLEVHVPGMAEAYFFLARPLGPPTADGFPLRIERMPDAMPASATDAATTPAQAPREAAAVGSGIVRGRRATTGLALTESHTKDLSQVGPLPKDDSFSGQALAGGKLIMETLIGRGGVGAVYKARHRELRIPVAVKVLHESFQHDIDFCRRFYAEALAASRLDHPNITRVLDFGQEPNGVLYLAMEYLDGVELRAVLEQAGYLSMNRVAELMIQTCAGLSHAHARGIVHRDIKPENLVMVPGHDDDGQPVELVKVCDFGIAQHRAAGHEDGVVAGTPEYMSPEQCRGDELDARSDVYAVGVVLYELATGQVPFTAERPQSILNKHQFTPPVPPSTIRPDIDPRLEKIILHALEKEPDDRPQTMRELRLLLKELLSSGELSPPPASVRTPRVTPPSPGSKPQPPPLPARANAAPKERESEPRQDQAPAWLERGPVYSAAAAPTPGQAPAPSAAAQAVALDEVASALATNPSAWLQRFATIQDPRTFAQLAHRLEPAVRALAATGDTKALWAVSSTLHAMAMNGTQAVGSRAHTAGMVLRVFDDPAILAGVAEQLLTGTADEREHARRILVNAGVAGAYGLYGARVKLANEQAIRGPFITVLNDFGPKAWPVVRAALEKIAMTDPSANARMMELAEDLLLCVPAVGDESAGHVVVKYLRVNVSGVCRAATASIVKMWGDRAKPLLVGMLQSKDDVVRIAGIAGLRQLNGIDEHVVPRLHALLTKRLPAGEELRAAAAVALTHVNDSAKQPALSLLAQLVTPPRGAPPEKTLPGSTSQTLSREDAVMLATARSLLALGGKNYRGLVAERAERSGEPLRMHLKKLLTS
ncbi:MAG: protein kinase [Deltaproteobacteria bacterium]|nr:protein kinase [Deltaproteobacteria bacterium]